MICADGFTVADDKNGSVTPDYGGILKHEFAHRFEQGSSDDEAFNDVMPNGERIPRKWRSTCAASRRSGA